MCLDLSALTDCSGLRRRNAVSMADAFISGILFDKKQVLKVSEYCMPVERENLSIYISNSKSISNIILDIEINGGTSERKSYFYMFPFYFFCFCCSQDCFGKLQKARQTKPHALQTTVGSYLKKINHHREKPRHT